MKQVLIPLVLAAIFIAAIGLFSQKVQFKNLKEISVSGHKIQAEIASTPEARRTGLAGRSSLTENRGMLFVFDGGPTKIPFWMKGMIMPIDIIWITNGKVVQIDKNVPPEPGTAEGKLKLYYPKEAVDYVLEVSAGFSDKNGIVLGAPIDLSGLK